MADQVYYHGKVDVKIAMPEGAYQSLTKLGEAMDMVQLQEQVFLHNVPGDRRGGPQGPPIEIQWLGAISRVTMELSRIDLNVFDSLRTWSNVNATGGTNLLTEVGTLVLEANPIRLLLDAPTRPINFPCAILRDSVSYAMGSKFSSPVLVFECHADPETNVLWNSSTS